MCGRGRGVGIWQPLRSIEMKSPVTKSWMRSILNLSPAPPPAPKRCVLFMVCYLGSSPAAPAAALGAVTQSLWRCKQVGGRVASPAASYHTGDKHTKEVQRADSVAVSVSFTVTHALTPLGVSRRACPLFIGREWARLRGGGTPCGVVGATLCSGRATIMWLPSFSPRARTGWLISNQHSCSGVSYMVFLLDILRRKSAKQARNT